MVCVDALPAVDGSSLEPGYCLLLSMWVTPASIRGYCVMAAPGILCCFVPSFILRQRGNMSVYAVAHAVLVRGFIPSTVLSVAFGASWQTPRRGPRQRVSLIKRSLGLAMSAQHRAGGLAGQR